MGIKLGIWREISVSQSIFHRPLGRGISKNYTPLTIFSSNMAFILCPYLVYRWKKCKSSLLGSTPVSVFWVCPFVSIFVPLRPVCPSTLSFIQLCNNSPCTFSHSHSRWSPAGWSELRAAVGGILRQNREACAPGRLLWPHSITPHQIFETPSCPRDWAWWK